MREDDVRLTADERAAFDAIERRLSAEAQHPALGSGSPRLRAGRRRSRTVMAWIAMATGCGLLAGALATEHVLLAFGALLVVVAAVGRLTRRWNTARLRLWWRRRRSPPAPPEHMWEP